MKKLIYTSFSPNTRFKDLLLNLRLLFSPFKWVRGGCIAGVIKFFESNYPGYNGYTFNYARSGMYVLFKSLGLKEADEVLVQGYTCVAAVNPVIWAGARVVYVDIDKRTGNMDISDLKSKITQKTKVVLFQHTYGNSSGVVEVEEICRNRGLLLVEDCTNTILGKNEDRLIGTYGAASIFSFGRDKAISGVDGGLVLIKKELDQNIRNVFMKEYKNIRYPLLKWILLELKYPVIWFFIKLLFNIKIGKLIHLVSTRLGILHRATSENEKKGLLESGIPSLLPNSLSCLALKQLVDIDDINKNRVKISKIYDGGLREIKEISGFDRVEGNVLLRYPIIAPDRDGLVNFLKEHNIYVGDWYTTPIAPVEVDMAAVGYKTGLCPHSEYVCKSIVNLPVHTNINETDALKIVNLIRNYYGD